MRQVKGASVAMLKTTDYRKALEKYKRSPRAFGIQRTALASGLTAGLLQPTHRHKIKVKGKTFSQVYTGFHSKKTAMALAKGVPSIPMVVRKIGQRGYVIYADMG